MTVLKKEEKKYKNKTYKCHSISVNHFMISPFYKNDIHMCFSMCVYVCVFTSIFIYVFASVCQCVYAHDTLQLHINVAGSWHVKKRTTSSQPVTTHR